MKFGLSDQQLNEIKAIIRADGSITRAILFGSRALGTYKEASDIDIAIDGESVTALTAAALKARLEDETDAPFVFDIVAMPSVESSALLAHIKEHGVVIFGGGGEWTPRKLGDFLKVKHGFAFKGSSITTDETSNILVTPGNFGIGGGFKDHKFKYCNGPFPEEYLFASGDIVVTMTDLSKEGDTLGYSAKVPNLAGKNFLHNQRVGKVLIKNSDLSADYCYWLMRTRDYQQFIVSSASGTSIRHTSPSTIESFGFDLPPLGEQKAIAEVLSSLDDKIDLLHRQNKTLESIAETIFRHWFIDGAQDDWEVGVLNDEFDYVMGLSPPGLSYNEDGLGMPMYQGNADFRFRFPSRRVFTIDPKRVAQRFDTLISVRAPVGEQNMAAEACCIGRGVAAFRYKRNPAFYSYCYFKLRSLMAEIQQFNETGTVFGSVSKADFDAFKITIPPQSLVDQFQITTKGLDDKVIQNCEQITKLEKLRDTLLPKLMSGDVRVDYEAAA